MRRLRVVASSNIAEIGYDREDASMEIVFTSSPQHVYTYKNVAPTEYFAIANADSVGSAFSTTIKSYPNKYPFTKRTEVTPHTFKRTESGPHVAIGDVFLTAAALRHAVDVAQTAISLLEKTNAAKEDIITLKKNLTSLIENLT